MMTIPVEIRKSDLHGFGVFSAKEIHRGQVVWMFHPGLDRRISSEVVKYCEPQAREFIMRRGYVNSRAPEEIVLCVDEAQFLNFPKPEQPANLLLGGLQDGEHMLIAAQDIAAGEELTVPPESDADYFRKMEAYVAR